MFRRPSQAPTTTTTLDTTGKENGPNVFTDLAQEPPLSPMSIPPTPGNENGFYFSRDDLKAVQKKSGTYSKERALDDLPLGRELIRTFLGGKMVEAERAMQEVTHFLMRCCDAIPDSQHL